MASTTQGSPKADERLLQESWLRKVLRRPELAAVGGAILVWVFFAIAGGSNGFVSLRGAANYLQVSAELGILAVAVSGVMIGGEFYLSGGSIFRPAGMIIAHPTIPFQWDIWAAM